MRLVPISHPRGDQRVYCATCRRSVLASNAFADLDAPAFTFRCVTDALEDGSRVVLSIPLRVTDATRLQTESRRLYAAQGGDEIDATIDWSFCDAVFECLLSLESFKDALGFRLGRPTAVLGTLALGASHEPMAWHWASHLGLMFQLEIAIGDTAVFRAALDDFGPRAIFADPSEYLGHSLRAMVASLASPTDMGFEINAHRLIASEHPNG